MTKTITIEQLVEAVPIAQLLKRYGLFARMVPVKDDSNRMRGRCPFHESEQADKLPFTINLEKNTYYCFSPSCREGGGIIKLVSKIENVSMGHAARKIVTWYKLPPLESNQAAQARRRRRFA